MLVSGLHGFLMLGEDYVSMVVCKDDIDSAILNSLLEARHVGKRTGEIAAELGVDHRGVSRRIYAMNKRMEDEMEEPIITKQVGRWRPIKKLRRDFAAARPDATNEEIEKLIETAIKWTCSTCPKRELCCVTSRCFNEFLLNLKKLTERAK